MSILKLNDLALQLVVLDFSDGHAPIANNGGPTKTSRALAIIHLAAHDAYGKVTGSLAPRLATIPTPPATLGNSVAAGSTALLGAGIRAATVLYPDFGGFIATEAAKISNPSDLAYKYGELVADAWIAARANDGSQLQQTDRNYNPAPGKHRPDPLDPQQQTLGRKWGSVIPFVLSSVVSDAPLQSPPSLDGLNDSHYHGTNYAKSFNEVLKDGRNDIINRDPKKGVIGIFWGYDGANKIGVPPRIYNQVVRAIVGFKDFSHNHQVQILTAINVAMADAGIAAWHWKYAYDVWRPVLGIREADLGWGPTGGGDNNSGTQGDPFWLPLGAPNSNSTKPNGTPGFPAYPSGHATFGSACFRTVAGILGKKPEDIHVEFVSDEFNGVTTDNTGVVRPRYKAKFTLAKGITDNNESRIWLGVHWRFDAEGGEVVGNAIAAKVVAAFPCKPT